jgi:hypothetical protein
VNRIALRLWMNPTKVLNGTTVLEVAKISSSHKPNR